MFNRSYKASFIFDTNNYQEPLETLYARIQELLKNLGATVTKVDHLGLKEFARVRRKKFSCGVYSIYCFDSNPSVPALLQEKLRLDNTVNRVFIQAC